MKKQNKIRMTCEHKGCFNTEGMDYVRLNKEQSAGWEDEPIFLCSKHSKNHQQIKNNKMKIYSKTISGRYWCYATIGNYDHSFEGKAIEEAQGKMKKLLEEKGLLDSVIWEPLKIEDNSFLLSVPSVTYSNSRIDNNPIG